MPPEQGTQERNAADIEAELLAWNADAEMEDAALAEQTADDAATDKVATQPSEAAAIEAELAEFEVRATRQGWVPRDQYKGDPKKWVDAKTFVERGERFADNLQREVAALKKRIEDFEGTKAAFVKFQEEVVARKDAELKEAIAALRVQRTQAIREGEDEQAVAIEDQIDLLKDQQKSLKTATPDAEASAAGTQQPVVPGGVDLENPLIADWIDDGNQWFKDEPKLRDYAIAAGQMLLSNGETARGRPFLDKVTEIMRRDFPRRFKKSEATAQENLADAVSGGSSAAGSKSSVSANGKTERDLPPVDRALMNQFIREGLTTKEKFLQSYFAGR